MWDFKGRHIVNLLQQESEFWAGDRRNLLPNLYVWVHALLWVAEHVRVHTWRTYMAVEAAGCPLFLGHHKIPLGQDLFLNPGLVFFPLGESQQAPAILLSLPILELGHRHALDTWLVTRVLVIIANFIITHLVDLHQGIFLTFFP